jgi:hypothetical protein
MKTLCAVGVWRGLGMMSISGAWDGVLADQQHAAVSAPLMRARCGLNPLPPGRPRAEAGGRWSRRKS